VARTNKNLGDGCKELNHALKYEIIKLTPLWARATLQTNNSKKTFSRLHLNEFKQQGRKCFVPELKPFAFCNLSVF